MLSCSLWSLLVSVRGCWLVHLLSYSSWSVAPVGVGVAVCMSCTLISYTTPSTMTLIPLAPICWVSALVRFWLILSIFASVLGFRIVRSDWGYAIGWLLVGLGLAGVGLTWTYRASRRICVAAGYVAVNPKGGNCDMEGVNYTRCLVGELWG